MKKYYWSYRASTCSNIDVFKKSHEKWRKSLEKTAASTLEFRIDGNPRLLIILFFATLPNLIQHSLFINFWELFQLPLLLQTLFLLIHMHSQQR